MNKILTSLLETNSLEIKEEKPFFKWSSGIESPIYCDNRRLLSYPNIRHEIVSELCSKVKEMDVDGICGVVTAGVPWGAMIAERLKLPFIYVRSKNKEHGKQNQIEGAFEKLKKVVVIEDLISTGKSSLFVCDVLKENNIETEAVCSIFNYDLEIAKKNFTEKGIKSLSLGTISELLNSELINERMKNNLKEFLC